MYEADFWVVFLDVCVNDQRKACLFLIYWIILSSMEWTYEHAIFSHLSESGVRNGNCCRVYNTLFTAQ